MEIIQVKIEELNPAVYNPREWSAQEREDLKKSIQEFGLVDPILVNSSPERRNTVIGGHFRLSVARELGYSEVPAVFVDIPSEEQEKRLNLRLNRNQGHWDWELLDKMFTESQLLEIGFTDKDIDLLEKSLQEEIKEDDFDAEKEYQQINEPLSKYGEIYELGLHRVMCGDSTKWEDVEKLVNGMKIDLIFTDPPYSVGYISESGNSYSAGKYASTPVFDDNKSSEETYEFYLKVAQNGYKITKEDASIFWWYASKQETANTRALNEAEWHLSQTIIWIKGPRLKRGLDYLRAHESCLFGWKKGNKHQVNKQMNNLSDIFTLERQDFDEMLDIWFQKRDATMLYEHPTQKPIKLAERAIKMHTRTGETIIDFFGGSGSTLLAAEQLGRRCFMMELDPKFCDVIRKRYERFINKENV